MKCSIHHHYLQLFVTLVPHYCVFVCVCVCVCVCVYVCVCVLYAYNLLRSFLAFPSVPVVQTNTLITALKTTYIHMPCVAVDEYPC